MRYKSGLFLMNMTRLNLDALMLKPSDVGGVGSAFLYHISDNIKNVSKLTGKLFDRHRSIL